MVNQGAGAREVAEAAKLIREAKSPILLVGHGVHTSRTQAEVKELADLMNCPVIQTSGGTSFIPGLQERTFPYLFSPAANQAVEESDLCVALGTELGEPMHYGRTQHWAGNDANRKWVYVEQDPTAIGVNRRFDVPLVGDLRGVVPQLVEALRDAPRSPSPNLETLVKADAAELARVAEEAPCGRTPVHPARYVVEATKAFDEFAKDGIMVRDGGATVIFQWTYSQSKPRDVIWNQNFGHLGTGLPYAVGASVAEGGKRPVMLLTSDSAFLFHIAELETAARGRTCRWYALWASTISGASRSACTSAPSSSPRRSPVCTGARTCGSTRSPRVSAAMVSSSRRRTRSVRRSSGRMQAARPPSCMSASTRRRTPRRCRSTTDSGPGMQKALSSRER